MSVEDPIRPEVTSAIDESWAEMGRPGAWWTGEQRLAIAQQTRERFAGVDATGTTLLSETIERVTTKPASTTEAWVNEQVEALGELPYIEAVGIVARTLAVETFDRLLGRPPRSLPEPQLGEPSREPAPAAARKNRTWVSMVTASAPLVLGAVPSAEAAMNALTDHLYLAVDHIGDPHFRRGDLTRPQIEVVATATSQLNECFY